MPLLTATIAFELGKKCWSFPQRYRERCRY